MNEPIATNDPQASVKLAARIIEMEAQRDRMKRANVLARKDDSAGLHDLGYSDQAIHRLLNPTYSYEKKGHQGWELTNLGANIKRLKERLKEVERLSVVVEKATEDGGEIRYTGGVSLVTNTDIARIQVLFPGKPDERTRSALKGRGFRWSPSEQAWQRQLTESAIYVAKMILKDLGFTPLEEVPLFETAGGLI